MTWLSQEQLHRVVGMFLHPLLATNKVTVTGASRPGSQQCHLMSSRSSAVGGAGAGPFKPLMCAGPARLEEAVLSPGPSSQGHGDPETQVDGACGSLVSHVCPSVEAASLLLPQALAPPSQVLRPFATIGRHLTGLADRVLRCCVAVSPVRAAAHAQCHQDLNLFCF